MSLINQPNTPPVFDVVFQVNPVDSEADYSLMMKVMPLEIVYNKSILEEICTFLPSLVPLFLFSFSFSSANLITSSLFWQCP